MRTTERTPPPSRTPGPTLRSQEPEAGSDSEVIVAVFRTVLVLVILVGPSVTQAYRFSSSVTVGVIVASAYSLGVSLILYRRLKFRFQRPLVLVVDMFLLTFLIYFCGCSEDPTVPHRSQLFPLYHLLVIVAAIWFQVFGALMTAALSSFTYLVLLFLMQAVDLSGEEFIDLLSAQIPFLFLVAMLSGYLAEAWERERQRRFDAQRALEKFQEQTQRNLELAQNIQELLLPATLPVLPNLDLGFRSRPAKTVGGDYYDVLPLPHDEVGFCVADVAGKSISGQLRLPIFKYALRACAHVYRTPGHTLTRLNNILHPELPPDMFISMAYGTLDSRRRKLLYTNAGHVPAILFHAADRDCELLHPPGIVLGVEPHLIYSEQRIEFRPQDCLIFYTDGLLEATNPQGEELGLEGLLAIIRDHPARTAQELADYLLHRVAEFEAGEKRDDATVLVVRRIGKGSPA